MESKQIFATKGNLLQAKKSLALAKTGFDLRPKAHELMESRVRGRFEKWCEEGAEALLSLMRATA